MTPGRNRPLRPRGDSLAKSPAKWENKLFEYRDTTSIEQIVIIESETRSVRSYVRDDDWRWQEEPTLMGDGVLAFRVDGVEMTLDEIYWRTSLAITALFGKRTTRNQSRSTRPQLVQTTAIFGPRPEGALRRYARQ